MNYVNHTLIKLSITYSKNLTNNTDELGVYSSSTYHFTYTIKSVLVV